jgi:ferredoxin
MKRLLRNTTILCQQNNTIRRRVFSSTNTFTKRYTSAASIAHSAVDTDAKQPSVTDNVVTLTLVDLDGNRHTVKGYVGQSLLDVAKEHQLPLYADETCAENCGCTLCHVVVSNEYYNAFPQPSEDENEMIQYAQSLSEKYVSVLYRIITYTNMNDNSSRLACQLILEKHLDGLVVSLPPHNTSPVTVDSFFRV